MKRGQVVFFPDGRHPYFRDGAPTKNQENLMTLPNLENLAPRNGLEPLTQWLTATCSTD